MIGSWSVAVRAATLLLVLVLIAVTAPDSFAGATSNGLMCCP